MLWKILDAHPELKSRCLKLAAAFLPIIGASANGRLLPVSDKLVADSRCFLRGLERVAPEPLNQQLRQLRRDLNKELISKLLKSS
jgi:hypothetical protein